MIPRPPRSTPLYSSAASDVYKRQVFLYTDGTAGRSPSLRQTGSRAAIEVQTRAIDEALSSGVLPEPDIVKLDIEGAEGLALTGMRQLLTSPGRPRTIF